MSKWIKNVEFTNSNILRAISLSLVSNWRNYERNFWAWKRVFIGFISLYRRVSIYPRGFGFGIFKKSGKTFLLCSYKSWRNTNRSSAFFQSGPESTGPVIFGRVNSWTLEFSLVESVVRGTVQWMELPIINSYLQGQLAEVLALVFIVDSIPIFSLLTPY